MYVIVFLLMRISLWTYENGLAFLPSFFASASFVKVENDDYNDGSGIVVNGFFGFFEIFFERRGL